MKMMPVMEIERRKLEGEERSKEKRGKKNGCGGGPPNLF